MSPMRPKRDLRRDSGNHASRSGGKPIWHLAVAAPSSRIVMAHSRHEPVCRFSGQRLRKYPSDEGQHQGGLNYGSGGNHGCEVRCASSASSQAMKAVT